MADPWFHLATIPPKGIQGCLPDREAKHARGARRLELGDSITLFDGNGLIATAKITHADRSVVEFRVNEVKQIEHVLPRVHLASALPKGDRQATLISMTTQLGVNSFTPLLCGHSVTTVGKNSIDRWDRIAIESCKQSRNAFLPRFEEALSPFAFTKKMLQNDGAAFVAHPRDEQLAEMICETKVSDIAIMVGPEGGFSDNEIAQVVEAGAQVGGLGQTVLRVETACVAAVTIARCASGSQR